MNARFEYSSILFLVYRQYQENMNNCSKNHSYFISLRGLFCQEFSFRINKKALNVYIWTLSAFFML